MTVFLKNMKHWDLVLREIFLVPPAMLADAALPKPESIEDLARLSGLTVIEATDLLLKVDALQAMPVGVDLAGLEMMRKEFHDARDSGDARNSGAELLLLDVRSRAEYAGGHLPDSISIHDIDFSARLPYLHAVRVVTVGRDDDHAWSAAMYLRDHGVSGARSLEI